MATEEFSNDVEGGAPQERKKGKERSHLSASAAVWDIDGDGQLDDTELALKEMDSSKQGTLTKQQMYQIMQQNLHVRQELSSMKKIIVALVGFTCLLALANVGVSFAAAFLAQDTKIQDGRLTSKNGDEEVATADVVDRFEVGRASRRRLCEEIKEGKGQTATTTQKCSLVQGWVLDADSGSNVGPSCEANHFVKLLFEDVGSPGTIIERQICPHTGHSSEYFGRKGMDGVKLHFEDPNLGEPEVKPIVVQKVDSGEYVITGLDAIPQLNQVCTAAQGCSEGMTCTSGVCKSDHGGACAATSDCALDTLMCDGETSTCKGVNGFSCTTTDDCATSNECQHADAPQLELGEDPGKCACQDASGCDSGLMCGGRCGLPDYTHKRCEPKEYFDNHCVEDNQPGSTCDPSGDYCMSAPEEPDVEPTVVPIGGRD